jgi:hypothetical protein
MAMDTIGKNEGSLICFQEGSLSTSSLQVVVGDPGQV